jgi:hypothetical protein
MADETQVAQRAPDEITKEEELPVVARLVVELRSDGTRTIARGAIVDVDSGQQVAIEVRASSLLELTGSLAKSLASLPMMLLKARLRRDRTRG